ncbi:uncharacterized protein LOC131633672 [Vicia villosa]|uniref:uncharacterized protein LOC131633672 n=1 Tax=Vicia villosa TaxID=3911 RepID=UPI00273C5414|nr:uncharacterized protein LOC131633672 [Vicia villosa]
MASAQVLPNNSASSRKQEHLEAGKRRYYCFPFYDKLKMDALVYAFVAFMLCGCAFGRECTNTPTQSHTLRYELGVSKNETWKKEVMAHYHVTPTDDSAWADLLPRKFLSEEHQCGWSVMYRNIKNLGVFKPPVGFLKEVPNLEYLLMLDVDRLIWSFRKTAGLPTPGKLYGGWETFDEELRGHFVGHYLSASALMWASTKNDSLKEKMSALVTGLSACQEKIGTGYLSSFPDEFFDRFEVVQFVWAPYYTIHKIMDVLLDQHVKAGNPQALKMLTWMVDYFYSRVMNVIAKYTVHRHYDSLNEETGGMNDVLYKLYSITCFTSEIILVHRGKCSFTTKANIADEAGASAIIIINNRTELFKMVCEVNETDVDIGIPAVMLPQDAGLNLERHIHNKLMVAIQLYSPLRPLVDVAEVFLWLMAVGTILCASYWSAWTAREAVIEQDKLLKVTEFSL